MAARRRQNETKQATIRRLGLLKVALNESNQEFKALRVSVEPPEFSHVANLFEGGSLDELLDAAAEASEEMALAVLPLKLVWEGVKAWGKEPQSKQDENARALAEHYIFNSVKSFGDQSIPEVNLWELWKELNTENLPSGAAEKPGC